MLTLWLALGILAANVNAQFPTGMVIDTGVSYAIVTGVSDTDNASTTADDVHGVIL